MPALFSNPVTAILGGALIGGALLSGLFGNKILKSLRGLVRGEYGIEVKSDKVLENLKALGESKFGKEFKRKQIETIRLPESKDLLVEYAARTGQKGNSRLVSTSALQDPFNEINRFAVRRETGGPLAAFQAAIVGERRPELFIPNTAGRIVPSVQFASGGQGLSGAEDMRALIEVLEDVRAAIAGLRGIPKGQVVEQGMAERPGLAARDVRRSFERRDEGSAKIRDYTNTR